MKKLMFAVAAMAAGIAVADITSSNIVGYSNKAAEGNLNFYAPQFVTVGCNTIDIQDIELKDTEGMVGYGDSMQIIGPLGNATKSYSYWAGYMDPTMTVTKDFYWANDDLTPVVSSIDRAAGIAIDNASLIDFNLSNAGEVIAEDVTVPAEANLNWLGNPFSANISIQDIELKDTEGMVGYGDSLQIVGPLGNASESFSYWGGYMDPTSTVTKDFYWANDDLTPVEKTLKPGDGFAIDNASELVFDIVIKCPYSL